jgi:hypothetical protein
VVAVVAVELITLRVLAVLVAQGAVVTVAFKA